MDWIPTKWNISTESNAHGVEIFWKGHIIFPFNIAINSQVLQKNKQTSSALVVKNFGKLSVKEIRPEEFFVSSFDIEGGYHTTTFEIVLISSTSIETIDTVETLNYQH